MIDCPEPGEVPPCGDPGVAGARAALDAAAQALAAVPVAELSDASLSALLVELSAAQTRLDAARVTLVGTWDSRLAWAADGARSGATWLAAHTEASRPAAAAEVRVARQLRAMPGTGAAFARGKLGQAKVRLLAHEAHEVPDAFARDEAFLVGVIADLRVDEAARALAHWHAHVDPDGTRENTERQRERRGVHLSQSLGGLWHLDGRLDAESGEVLRDALNRLGNERLRAEKAEADAAGTIVTSTAAHRRADALVELARQANAQPDGGARTVPSVTLVLQADKLTDPATTATDVVGETVAGTPVPAEQGLRWCCDTVIGRVVLGPDSLPVDLGRSARLVSPAQRRALVIRDRGCTFPGCDCPPGRADAHHLVHWAHGGATDLENLALLCSFHHHRVHEGGFGARRRSDGTLAFTRPDGSLVTVPKHTGTDPPWPHAA